MIRTLLFVVIGILILSFFGISLQSLVNSPVAQENFHYLWSLVVYAWDYVITFFQNLFAQAAAGMPKLPFHHF